MVKQLSTINLKNISKKKYKSHGKSYMELFLDPFNNFIVKQIPQQISPNAITIFATIIIGSPIIFMTQYDPSLKLTNTNSIHPLFYIIQALSILIFQILDELDGKHARNTGITGPIGEFMDHGLDTMTFVQLFIGLIFIVNDCYLQTLMTVLMYETLISVNMMNNHYEIQLTNINKIGVLEGQTLIYTIEILYSFLGNYIHENIQIMKIFMIVCALQWLINLKQKLFFIFQKDQGLKKTLMKIILYHQTQQIWAILHLLIFQSVEKYKLIILLANSCFFAKIVLNKLLSEMAKNNEYTPQYEYIIMLLFQTFQSENNIVSYMQLMIALSSFQLYFQKITVEIAEYLGANIILVSKK